MVPGEPQHPVHMRTEPMGLPPLCGRLHAAVAQLSHSIRPLDNLAILQVWRPSLHQPPGLDALQKQLYTDPHMCIVGCAALAPFRLSSCQGPQLGHQGMPGRALRSGCVQVVQNLRIIPEVLHPRCRLPDAAADEVGEVVYVPVYDLQAPAAGPVAVLEALLSARATDSMMVANFISVAGSVLALLQLSLSNPLPQPVKRSKLEGRKPRPVHVDSSPELAAASWSAQPAVQAVVPSAAGAVHACPPAAAAAAATQPHVAVCSPVGSPCFGQQHDGSALAAAGAGSPHHLASCSSASASTVVGGAGAALAGTTCAAAASDCALLSTLSSRPREISAAVTAAAAEAATHGAMLPPRPYPAGRQQQQQQQHRRQRQPWEDASAPAPGSADGDDDSPPPCKLRRTLSITRTKSVAMGLDQVLAAAAVEAAASC